MEKVHKELTSADICSIIKACGDSGVRSFEFGKLKLALWENNKAVVAQATFSTPSAISIPQDESVPEKQQKEQRVESDKEQYMTDLMLTNPAEFERILMEEANK